MVYDTILYYTMLYHTILYYNILLDTKLYYTYLKLSNFITQGLFPTNRYVRCSRNSFENFETYQLKEA